MTNHQESWLEAYSDVVKRQGWLRFPAPSDLVSAYDQVVAQILDGYSMDIYEYETDLLVRDRLATVLADSQLRSFVELQELSAQVDAIDDKLWAVLILGADDVRVGAKWTLGVPRYAGPELANDLRARYGVAVEVR